MRNCLIKTSIVVLFKILLYILTQTIQNTERVIGVGIKRLTIYPHTTSPNRMTSQNMRVIVPSY